RIAAPDGADRARQPVQPRPPDLRTDRAGGPGPAVPARAVSGMPAELPAGLAILGPTGCGRSALAMQLAAALPVEIISVDSAQVYRGMDIGTAKPTPAERQAVPHHLVDIRDPEQAYSAGEFRADALRLIDEI